MVSVAAVVIATIQTARTNKLSHLPILVIRWDGQRELWQVQNVGNGPALNIVVAQQAEDGTDLWYNPVSIPAIPSGESFDFLWLGSGESIFSLGARYSDFLEDSWQHQYFAYARHDRCVVYPPDRLPGWTMPKYEIGDTRRFWEKDLPRDLPVEPN